MESTPELAHIGEALLAHHEWWDGTGYPKRLKGEQIPLISRILAIADAYDVMTHDRPYRKAVSKEEAMREIEKCIGTQFDPQLGRPICPDHGFQTAQNNPGQAVYLGSSSLFCVYPVNSV